MGIPAGARRETAGSLMVMGKEIFYHRRLVIATKHKKEKVIAPLLAEKLRVKPLLVEGLDTDQFGTFSGEIERRMDPLSAVREKCKLAMQFSGCDLAVASEGSFGMHPFIPFVPADDELILLMDRLNGFEIVGRKLSTDTNFDGKALESWEDLYDFAVKSGFPEHGLVMRNAAREVKFLEKGIISWQKLQQAYNEVMNRYGTAFAETDMRAHCNPRRMKVIGEASEELVKLAETSCPLCQFPGFGITGKEAGLPCRNCGSPTRTALYYVYGCGKCRYNDLVKNPSKQYEDPMYCDYCNP